MELKSPPMTKQPSKHKFKPEKKPATKKGSLNRSLGGAVVSDTFKRSTKQLSTLSSQKLMTNNRAQNNTSKERSNSSAGAGS